ncbi:3-hydroxyisobutyrate dehydrogenase [Agrobacterium fabrum]|jgi:3-hydroxyisobutyrate dehydrogenase|uniref:3-hydroxyisobutyrate dehydrogenase n=1 Tax=Agrobacterium fabrum TaxID=1176649 RepID=A0A7Z7BR93_9HYPH|nr:3-hydroxyisobutyrate dehydrogenase [Agrobacterium fabrum]MCR6726430.1 3-hydroxyisobutyrate dehydrogenase [Agrobacterium fabrum]NTB09783.1 3-hydroxyisobutyrate dehydrogenase [Agrobacterium fabrum]UXT59871.1 3-hydroxyisobutyrate dehydrogenase [Agrobacterium fabrum]WCK78550.1 3-hydroxyisobutyrate dehydrogenase [Agrobacterium fabrum]WIE29594.1 3-hydroxyisobutyrate dehydrogenase [Agrobacterium fabrum]
MKTVAFLGLGHMGLPMAANLVKAGYTVRGYDLAEACRAAAREAGIPVAADATEATHAADVVITMLPKGEHVVSVYGDLVKQVSAGTLLVDCSTVDMESALKAHELAASVGCPSIDAPVSGGTSGAAAGALTFMCGGEPEAFSASKSVLEAMGKKIVHCGKGGNGQAAKICNNMILGISMIAVSEAFVLGEKLGLSHQALFDVASTSSGQCWSLTTYCPVPGPVPTSPANKDYQPGFAAALMLKDLKLSQAAANGTGVSTPLGAAASALYESFVGEGGGGRDFSAIVEMLRGGEA